MDELKTLIKELEHPPPPSLARQRRLLEATAARPQRRTWFRRDGRAGRGRARGPGLPALGGRRLALGGAVAGAAIVASVAVPMLTGSSLPAYAVTRNSDGSVTLQINEFRDPGQVERELGRLGIRADITYLPLGKRCEVGRAPIVKGDDLPPLKEEPTSRDPAVLQKLRDRMERTASFRAIRPEHGITIYPRYIEPGQTVLIEIMENPVEPTVDHPGVAWQFSGRLTDGPIKPCQVVDDPSAFDIGDATPPPGS